MSPNGRGQRALELVHGGARLERCDSVHEIRDGFGLHEVQPAVEVGAQSELAGFGQPRSGGHRELDDAAEQDGTAMRADLHDVLAGEGMRRGEERHDDSIEHTRPAPRPGLARRCQPASRASRESP